AADPVFNRDNLAKRLASAVREAGEFGLTKFRSPLKNWIQGDPSPVSEVDIASNELLQAALCDPAGEMGWLSEETEDDPKRLQKRRLWSRAPSYGHRPPLTGR